MKKAISIAFLLAILAGVNKLGHCQTTTADGSLPGTVDASERMHAKSDPFVKKNADNLKKAKLDPVALLRIAERVDSARNKSSVAAQQVSFLKDTQGIPLSTKGEVLTAYLYAKEKGLKG